MNSYLLNKFEEKPMAETKEEPKEEPKPEGVKLVEVPTEMGIAYQLPDGKVVNMQDYLVWLGNKVNDMSKTLN